MEENKATYIINIGNFTADGTTYENRCLSASFGGAGIASEVIPWEGTEHQPWDYKALFEMVEIELPDPLPEDAEEGAEPSTRTKTVKHYTGEFVLEPIAIPEAVEEPTQLDRIEAQTMFTALMTDTLLEA